MTIPSTVRKAGPFVGNDVVISFAFGFKIFDASDVRVVITDAAGVESAAVGAVVTPSVDQDTTPGGSVTLATPLPSGYRVTVVGDLPYTQTLALTNHGGFYPATLNDAFDRGVVQAQQLEEAVSRSIQFPVSDDALSMTDLPGKAARVGKVLGFDATTGAPIAGPTLTDIAGASAAANAAAQSEINAGISETNAFNSAFTAGTQANLALTRAGNAANSATAANNSQIAAAVNEANSYTNRLNAAASAQAAANSATDLAAISYTPDLLGTLGQVAAYALTDDDGYAAHWVDANGDTHIGKLQVQTQPVGKLWGIGTDGQAPLLGAGLDGSLELSDTLAVEAIEIPGISFAISDDDGQAAFLIGDDGAVIIAKADEPPAPAPAPLLSLQNQSADMRHVFMYGQSLSRGYLSSPVLSTVQPYANYTFASGVLPHDVGDTNYTGIIPLVEAAHGSEAETPTSGFANRLTEMAVAAGGSYPDWQFFGTAPGRSGESIAFLSKGGTAYPKMLAQVESAAPLLNAVGLSYLVWCLGWAQGETDYIYGTSQAVYKQKLIQLKNDFAADCAAITKQGFAPPMVTYQTAAHRKMGAIDHTIARAQHQASHEDPDIIMACPAYALEHGADKLHLTNEGSRQMGRYFANALYRSLENGVKWRPLEPLYVLWQGVLIDITFTVPVGELEFDTTLVSAAPNMGFDIYEAGVVVPGIISSVTILSKNRVRFLLSRAAASDAVLTYARGRITDPAEAGPLTGARGNLRDTAGLTDYYTDDSSNTRRMHNWCVMFSYRNNQGLI